MLHLIYIRRILQRMIAESREKCSARFLLQNVSSLRFISSISNPTVTKPHSFTVSYLVSSCGLSPESALSASKKLNLKTPKNPDSVIELLRNHGFTDTQITKLVTKAPSILLSNPQKTLLRKINVLKRYGISGTDLIKVISSNPSLLLQASVNTEIIPSFDFLRSLVKTDDNIVTIVRRSSRILQSNLEKKIGPNIAIIRSQGVPDSNIANLMMTYPRTVLLGVERFSEIVAFVKKMDFNPSTRKFTFAIRVMSALKKLNWERKMKVYQGLGWSEEECLSTFKLRPQCMMISEKKIKKVADFFRSEMGWNPVGLSKYPNLLRYSLEKRTIPRCLLLRILITKGLIKEEPHPFWMLNLTEKQFLERILIKYQDLVPEIVTVYQGTMGHVL
eukprot:TRINITY_DN5837_c0_g1_i2.p1 TRINITY_DN5837_c0_g1~~TRINITY_DN5837_c0_g1_i2.p1  ORF type:complete len:389 (-),score=23.05 TRINITY_DN5837_c0_g1_i2:736-1902(-)